MDAKSESKSITGLDFASDGNFHWAGATYRSLGGAGAYNPRVPVLVGTSNKSRAEDDIAWADQPKWSSLRTRLANKEQRIDRDRVAMTVPVTAIVHLEPRVQPHLSCCSVVRNEGESLSELSYT